MKEKKKAMVTLTATQARTVEWARRNETLHSGGIIAHKPGCGKTFIAISLTAHNAGTQPDLYVVPPTLTLQWQAEVCAFNTSLSSEVYVKNDEERLSAILLNDDPPNILIISYYTLLHADVESSLLFTFKWHRIIADEAHQIRNPDTAISRAMQTLQAQYRWAMSGTTMMNSVSDLYGLCKFIRAANCSTKQRFDVAIRRGLVGRIMMQSSKADIAALALPPLHDKTLFITMTPEEKATYNAIRRQGQQQVLKDAKSTTSMLKTITDLRIAASTVNSKVRKVAELVSTILAADNANKVLIFCNFRQVIELYCQALKSIGIRSLQYTGDVAQKERDMRIVRFKTSQSTYRVLVLGFKCGNAGINLQCAQHVILDAPNWYESINDQAIARAHRKGQTKSVHVYRLHTRHTIEDRIAHLSRLKQKQITQALKAHDVTPISKLNKEDMQTILQL